MKLVSFLMPTRNSFESLDRALLSIQNTCPEEDDFEILLRIDDDDFDRIARIPEFETVGCRCVVGSRGIGYTNMPTFINELAAAANSQWCWLFDDDAYVEGEWYGQLKDIDCDPINGPAVNAENYCLGPSVYKNHSKGEAPGLIMPTAFVKKLKHTPPCDQQWLDEIIRQEWTIVQLRGVSYFHDGRPR